MRGRGGSGLGLNIVYSLISAGLHGTVDVESRPGKGTTFTIRFPRVLPKIQDLPPSASASAWAADPGEFSEGSRN
jgi:signal transduction histidine kinase